MKKITILLETESENERIEGDLTNHLLKDSLQDKSRLKEITIEDIE